MTADRDSEQQPEPPEQPVDPVEISPDAPPPAHLRVDLAFPRPDLPLPGNAD